MICGGPRLFFDMNLFFSETPIQKFRLQAWWNVPWGYECQHVRGFLRCIDRLPPCILSSMLRTTYCSGPPVTMLFHLFSFAYLQQKLKSSWDWYVYYIKDNSVVKKSLHLLRRFIRVTKEISQIWVVVSQSCCIGRRPLVEFNRNE